jgi:hypothetical protein
MNSRLVSILLFLLAFSPALWMADYMAENAVDAGCWDDWENGPLLKKWNEGTLTLKDLYAPQIQHRIVFPRLIIIALTYLGDGDFRPQQYFALFLSVVSAVLLWLLLRRSLGDSRWVYGIMFAANLLIFSPMHYQTYFWNSAMWMCIPIPCILGALLVLGARRPPLWVKWLLAVLIAQVATHSFTQGMLLWPVLVAYVALQPDLGPLRQRLIYAAIMFVIMVITLKFYFHDFKNTAWHAYGLKPGDDSLAGGVKLSAPGAIPAIIRFFFGLFGALFARNPFSGHLEEDAKMLGPYVFAPFLLLSGLFVLTHMGRSQWCRALPLLALAGYATGVALAVAVGRAHVGEHRCVLPRYFTMTQYVPIAIMALGFLLSREWLHSGVRLFLKPETWKRLALVSLTAFSVFQWHLYEHGKHLALVWNNARLTGQALTLFINHPEITPWSYEALDCGVTQWNITHTREAVKSLRDCGFSKPKVLETAEIVHFQRDKKEIGPEKAVIDSVTRHKDQVVVVGNARLGSARPANLLFFTAPGSDKILATGVPTPQAMVRLFPLDYEFNNPHDVPVGEPYRFEARFPASLLEQAGGRMDIWLLDQKENRIHLMKQRLEAAMMPSNPELP